MTTISDLIKDLSRLGKIDREKNVTLNGQPIQSISVKEYKHETVFPVKDINTGEQLYKMTEEKTGVVDPEIGELLREVPVLDDNGDKIPLVEVVTDFTYKVFFTTGKETSDFKTVNKLIEALKTLSTVEREGTAMCENDDIFIVGDNYKFADRVNIDTDMGF